MTSLLRRRSTRKTRLVNTLAARLKQTSGNIGRTTRTTRNQVQKGTTTRQRPKRLSTRRLPCGYRKRWLKEKTVFVLLENTDTLPPRALNSVVLSTTVILQFVLDINKDIQEIRAINIGQRAQPMHINFERASFSKNFIEKT